MKQWKNGEKFSAIDYTSERNVIKDTIIEKELESNFKDRKLFILNDEKPPVDYIDTIWMDSGLILNKLPGVLQLYINALSTAEASLSFEKNYEVTIASVVTLQADYEISGVPIQTSIESDSSADAEVFQIQPQTVETDITHIVTITGNMQQDLSKSVPEEITSTIITTAGMQQDLNEDVLYDINGSILITGGVQQDVNEDISTGINSTSIVIGDAQLDIEESVIETIESSVSLVGNAQTDTDASLQEIIDVTVNVDALMQTDVNVPIELSILNEVTVGGGISFDIEKFVPEQVFESSVVLEAGQTFDITAGAPEVSTTGTVLVNASQDITVTSVFPVKTITGSVTVDGLQGDPVFLLQARAFGASAVIDAEFSDTTGVTQFYLPGSVNGGPLVTVRSETPKDVLVELTADETVDYNGDIWYFEKWRINSIGFETSTLNVQETVTKDEIYEVYYELPPTSYTWEIVGPAAYVSTFSIFSNDTGDSAIIAATNAAYPASDEQYAVGSIYRVRVYDSNFTLIATKYVRKVFA